MARTSQSNPWSTLDQTPQIGTVGKAESAYLPGVKVPEVNAGGAAERAGIRAGDVLLRVGDYQVKAAPDQVAAVVSTIKAHAGDELRVELDRSGQRLSLPVTPVTGRDGRGAIGISLYSNTFIKHTKPNGFGNL
jgi:S1-C subfamily serine protease